MRKHIASYVSAALLIGGLAVAVPLTASSADPVVINVTAAQRVGTNLMDVAYSLSDADSPTLAVAMLVSTNAGVTFDVACPSAAGDIGANVVTGANKQIVWNGGADLPDVATSQLCVRILADDSMSMALIPAGPFTMGNCMTSSEGGSDELPMHTVMVSAFYMDKHEVTSQQWFEVRTWALANGYAFGAGSGKAANHPAQSMNWYDCVKWCNARSEKEGLTPCYYTSAVQTQIYRIGLISLSNDCVNWSANGYRLPTEAEWEKAARGGASGHRFPWSQCDTITFTNANYYSYWSAGVPYYPYDKATQSGYNPTFATGGSPYTSPAGYFAPNGYGLYDMAGNVWEWCWDWYDESWYSNASATQTDTSGPTSSPYSFRVVRGGGWYYGTDRCRVARRRRAGLLVRLRRLPGCASLRSA